MNSCDKCEANCCKYVTVSIDDPEDVDDLDEFKWFVMHENVKVYQDTDEDWKAEFRTPCKNLGKDNKCKIYEKRPIVCRDYDVEECHGMEPSEKLVAFYTAEDVEKYFFKESDEVQKVMMFFNVYSMVAKNIGLQSLPLYLSEQKGAGDEEAVACCGKSSAMTVEDPAYSGDLEPSNFPAGQKDGIQSDPVL